ncbi:MAG: hypothetical protein QNJ05_03935 [Woeseiaceae bacterium]|nr:hypothetical protein [Woeseiaceae bacterium]
MRLSLLTPFVFLTACTAGTAEPRLELIGRIDIPEVDEASGLARSQRDPDLMWVHNDDGKPRVYAFDRAGQKRGRLTLEDARNRDWEDMSSFTLDGKPYLLIADVGDNMRRRKSVILYIVEEPDLGDDDKVRSDTAWEIELRFPDGPRDVESVTVDIENERVLLLSKRDLPPVLYSVPLRPEEDDTVTATRLGEIRSLPPPRRSDVVAAPKSKSWFWQPTAIDLHGDTAVILTYRALYWYNRQQGESWFDALNRKPERQSLGRIPNAESAAINADRSAAVVTVERKRPPFYRAPSPLED